MRIHIFILILSVVCIISCSECPIEKEGNVITRSVTDNEGYYGSNFYNVSANRGIYGIEGMEGFLDIYPTGGSVEYDFILAFTRPQPGVKAVVSISGGDIIYNGHQSTYIYAEPNEQIYFKAKLYNRNIRVNLSFEKVSSDFEENRVYARLVINRKSCNGEVLPSIGGDFPDLTIEANFDEHAGDVDRLEWHWKCPNCGALNTLTSSICTGCGQSREE